MSPSENLKKFVKKSTEKALRVRYHYISNKVASKALKTIETEKGKLSDRSKKMANEYAVDVLGWKGYAFWLYVYTHVSGEFKEGWLPDNYYGKTVIQRIQGDYGKVSFLKPFTNRLFNSPICPDLAYFINGYWFSGEGETVTAEQVRNIVRQKKGKFVFKSDFSYQGRGVSVHDALNFDVDAVSKKGNGVLQYFIDQHAFFNEFTKDSVATIRMTTVMDNSDKPSLRAGFVRFGRAKDTHVRSGNQILVPVDIETGQLQEKGYFSSYASTFYHPDSKESFSDKVLPHFDKCVRLVLELQAKMPMVRTIGWDLAVNGDDEPVVMEWNGFGSGIAFTEATQGPSFKDLNWERFSSRI